MLFLRSQINDEKFVDDLFDWNQYIGFDSDIVLSVEIKINPLIIKMTHSNSFDLKSENGLVLSSIKREVLT